jgi:transcriptional regulator with XRE-family HTH domain
MTLPTWLNDQFREWEKKSGRRQTVTAFARWLGIKQPTLNRWMSGDTTPDAENLRVLSRKLGTEIYIILGLKIPADLGASDDPFIREAEEILRSLPANLRAQALSILRNLAEAQGENERSQKTFTKIKQDPA